MTNDECRIACPERSAATSNGSKEIRGKHVENSGCDSSLGLRHPLVIPRAGRRAFTFVEILAALAFLAILVPVIVSGLTVANRASIVSERSAIAAELAENKLNELLLNDAWATSEASGNFEPDMPGYRWEMSKGNWEVDNMIDLRVDVLFTVQGRPHSVRLNTLVSQPTTTS